MAAARSSLAALRALRARPAVRALRTSAVLGACRQDPLTPAQQPSPPPFKEPTGVNPALVTAKVNTPLHEYGQYITTCLPKYIQQFSVYKDELTVYVAPSGLIQTLTFLRDHTNCQYKQVVDITAVDYPTREKRFEVGSGRSAVQTGAPGCAHRWS
jgi:NADH dehydrogenase (ubiquinone) Fe-S protein 3